MHISFFTHEGGTLTDTGFGRAGLEMVRTFQGLGNRVTFDNPEAEVQLMFTQPTSYKPFHGPNIGYTPWESTKIPEDWYDGYRHTTHNWATSELNKQWFEDLGIEIDYVFSHGVSGAWSPYRRRVNPSKVRFLHLGDPAPRKSAQAVFDAFVNLFGNTQHTLTIKSNGPSAVRYEGPVGIQRPHEVFSNVKLITESVPEPMLISIFKSHDVLVYPSWGEGFGFIPLQAMATGMPVIFTPQWAPYSKFSVGLDVDATLADSPWPLMHPGKMLRPSQSSIESNMVEFVEHAERYATLAYESAESVHKEFGWLRVCAKAQRQLVNIV